MISGADAVVMTQFLGENAASVHPCAVAGVQILEDVILAIPRNEKMPPRKALVLNAHLRVPVTAHDYWLLANFPPLGSGTVLTKFMKRCHIYICLRMAAPGQTFPGSLSTCYLRKHQAKVTVAGGDCRGFIPAKNRGSNHFRYYDTWAGILLEDSIGKYRDPACALEHYSPTGPFGPVFGLIRCAIPAWLVDA